jgi:hypothetical protein
MQLSKPVTVVLTLMLCFFCLSQAAQQERSRKTLSQSGANAKNLTRRVLDDSRLAMNLTDRAYIADYSSYANDTTGWTSAGAFWFYKEDPAWPRSPLGAEVSYDQGPWIIGKLNGRPAAAVTEWRGSFMPGPIIGGLPAMDVRPQDSSRYHPYRISRSNKPQDSQDYLAWPIDLGAPVDEQGHPRVLGDQLVWCVYNGADSTVWPDPWRPRVPSDTVRSQFPRLPVEVHQSVYTHHSIGISDSSLLANVVFIEWTFINKGTITIDSCYLGLWTDMDIDPGAGHPAVDTALSLGYCWTVTGDYSGDPFAQAAGYVLLYGPTVPDPSHTALVRGQKKPGCRNLGLSSFFGHAFDTGSDSFRVAASTNIRAAWNVARGFDKLGQPVVDPTTQQVTRFPYSGDPVAGTGWIWDKYFGFEEGFTIFSGPFTFAPGDSQWMMTALIPTNSGDYKQSITTLRDITRRLHAMPYDQIVAPSIASGVNLAGGTCILPERPLLTQNYPNPFNPSTTVRFGLPRRSHVTLTVLNTLGQNVRELVNGVVEAGYHDIHFDATNLASGVYFFHLAMEGFTETKRLVVVR